MTQKTKVIELFEAGKDYDEIQTETGAKRTYIRTIVSQHKKTLDEGDMGNQTGEQKKEKSEIDNDESNSMDFKNDLEGANTGDGDNMGNQKTGAEHQKTGAEHHKAWVEAKALECNCGCTLNRRSKFCPNCGVTLDWSGF